MRFETFYWHPRKLELYFDKVFQECRIVGMIDGYQIADGLIRKASLGERCRKLLSGRRKGERGAVFFDQ